MAPGAITPMTMKRIRREVADLKKEDLGEIVLEPSENLQIWRGSIPGPQGSVYEGGVFKVEIQLPNDYPFSAPKVQFKTRIYHMNISEQGGICIDILKNNWSPALSLFKVMLSLSSLLTDPNPKDPLVPSVATQYMRSRKQHDATAREWTTVYAKAPPPPVPSIPVSVPAASRAQRNNTVPTSVPSTMNGAGATSSSRPMRSSNAASSSTAADEVIILDSDEEDAAGQGSSSKGKKRKRASNVAAEGSVLEIADSDEEESEKAALAKKKKTKAPRSNKPSSSRSGGQGPGAGASGSGSSTSGTRRSARLGDVIVIDD